MTTRSTLGEHEMRCRTCGEPFDMRYLGEVFKHETCSGWSDHDAECQECGASTQTNGEIIHCERCTWWWDASEDQ